MVSDLAKKTCIPCSGGVPKLVEDRITELLEQIPGWEVVNGHHITRIYEFPDFVEALAFVNRIGDIAEGEGHHPDIYLTWGRVRIEIWTHKVDGLTESDFVLAAKIDAPA